MFNPVQCIPMFNAVQPSKWYWYLHSKNGTNSCQKQTAWNCEYFKLMTRLIKTFSGQVINHIIHVNYTHNWGPLVALGSHQEIMTTVWLIHCTVLLLPFTVVLYMQSKPSPSDSNSVQTPSNHPETTGSELQFCPITVSHTWAAHGTNSTLNGSRRVNLLEIIDL